jgi:hypothetical protein
MVGGGEDKKKLMFERDCGGYGFQNRPQVLAEFLVFYVLENDKKLKYTGNYIFIRQHKKDMLFLKKNRVVQVLWIIIHRVIQSTRLHSSNLPTQILM